MYAFPESMQTRWPQAFYEQHEEVTSRIGAEVVHNDGATVTLSWTVAQAKAWQLLHLFLYDLSVHDQFMRSGQKPRSEHRNSTAEGYALRTAARMLPAYEKVLGTIL
jgi:hypothetical protein